MAYQSPFVYRHNIFNGYPVPPFFTKEKYDNTLHNQPLQDGDVIISTFPKSGTTLTQNVVYQILHGDIPKHTDLQNVCPWHEVAGTYQYQDQPNSRRPWKSHLNWADTFKTDKKIKYIYVARNGRDVAVSLLHHARGIGIFQ